MSLDNCFVDRVIEPLVLIDVASGPISAASAQPEGQNTHAQAKQTQFSTLQPLTEYLGTGRPSSYSCRFM